MRRRFEGISGQSLGQPLPTSLDPPWVEAHRLRTVIRRFAINGLNGLVTVTSARIFISYRREETAYAAGWLFDRLTERFGSDQVFKDVDCIEPGQDFVDEITRAVGSCDVLLALIGNRWLNSRDATDRRRLDVPDDYVRLEIEAALQRKVRIIPVLVDGASMPTVEELPTSLGHLVRRHALELSPSRFSSDSSKLFEGLDRVLSQVQVKTSGSGRARLVSSAGPPKHRRRSPLVRFGGPLAIGVGTVVVIALWTGRGNEPSGLPQSQPLAADELVVSMKVDGPARLYRVSSKGAWNRDPLTQATDAHGPLLSPDRRTIIYLSGTVSPTPRVMAADGSHDRDLFPQPIPGCGDVGRVAWNGFQPNILALVCVGSDGSSQIALVRTDGTHFRQLPTTPTATKQKRNYVDSPTFSPDGTQIAYWANEEIASRRGALFTIATSGRGKPIPLTKGPNDFDPVWSPRGDQIAFSRMTKPGRDGHSEIHLIGTDPRGESDIRLVQQIGTNRRPVWSPTGSQIAYVNELPGAVAQVLWLVNADGNLPHPLRIGAKIIETGSWGLAAQ
jgi:hypothetical protein